MMFTDHTKQLQVPSALNAGIGSAVVLAVTAAQMRFQPFEDGVQGSFPSHLQALVRRLASDQSFSIHPPANGCNQSGVCTL